jgi:hypothetical protein
MYLQLERQGFDLIAFNNTNVPLSCRFFPLSTNFKSNLTFEITTTTTTITTTTTTIIIIIIIIKHEHVIY